MSDIDTIRRMLDAGDPVPSWIVRRLCEQADSIAALTKERDELLVDRERLRVAGQRVLSEIEAGDESSDDVRMLESLCTYDNDGEPYDTPFDRLLAAARAWADAIDRCDGVAAAEERLLEVVREL